MADAELKVRIDAETAGLASGLNKADGQLKKFSSSATKSVNSFTSGATSAFKLAAVSIGGALSVGAFVNFGKEVLAATAEYEKFNAVLGNTLGSSSLAKLKLKEIQEFAAKTPFGVNELTSSFVKLANQGFKPTGDQMRSLGDLASSTGKSFDQLAEAVIDAQTGEFERLKEFGVRAKDAGDKVIFTFKGVQTTVDKSSSAIRDYVTSLGNAEGVSGSMSVISETLTGKISNLGDSWDQMLISVGSNTSGIFSGAIGFFSEAINEVTKFNKELEIASKFKIEGSFFQGLIKAGGKISGIPALGALMSTKDINVAAIQAVEKGVTGIVQESISGAKSITDFGTAIAKLKAEGDKVLQGGADTKVKTAFKSIYEEGIKTLSDARTAFENDAQKVKDAAKQAAEALVGLNAKEIAKLQSDLKDVKLDNYLTGLGIAFETSGQGFETFKNKFAKTKEELAKELTTGTPLLDINTLLGGASFMPDNLGKQLYTPFEILKDDIQYDLLPQLGTSFKSFFDDMLMNGNFSFKSLGESIKNTFLSVLASEATQGILSLLGSKGKDGGKGGGILSSVIGLLGAGKKAGPTIASVAASTGGFLGTGAALGGGTAATLATGTAATGGALIPILAGVAAVAGIASLFKKKKVEPQPAFTTSNAVSSYQTSSIASGSGTVVFEISGTNLVGVLNRAGAKLQRFGP